MKESELWTFQNRGGSSESREPWLCGHVLFRRGIPRCGRETCTAEPAGHCSAMILVTRQLFARRWWTWHDQSGSVLKVSSYCLWQTAPRPGNTYTLVEILPTVAWRRHQTDT